MPGLQQGQLQLAAQFFTVWQVELVALTEELTVELVGGVFDEQFVLVAAQDDADGRVVALGVFFVGEVAQIHVHLVDVVVPYLAELEVDEQ